MSIHEPMHSLAVLIDADNTSARYAKAIFEEVVKLGEANVRRIYGDFSDARLSGWDKEVQSLAILQHQQRSNTVGKNSSDIALVIDAMDLMHKGKLDGFCLISSDSDFTRLAQRLREDGLVVYGFGEKKTPIAFRNACNRFIYVENLIDLAPEKNNIGEHKENIGTTDVAEMKKEPPSTAVPIIAKATEESEESEDHGWMPLGPVGKRIHASTPDFDPRTYGCPNLSTLVQKSGGFEVRRDPSNAVYIRRKVMKPAAKPKLSPGNTK